MVYSLFYVEDLIALLRSGQTFVLNGFDWLFNVTVLAMALVCAFVYLSPYGKRRIGGEGAKPVIKLKYWFGIVLCSSVAAGLMFWSCAEPLYHLYNPPDASIPPESEEAINVAFSTLYCHWTFLPYSIYTALALLFAISYYDLGRAFSVSSMLLSSKKSSVFFKNFIDALCLFALVAGMAAALGAGVLMISGGLQSIFGIPQTPLVWLIIVGVIVLTFVLSSISGLYKGITWLSNFNMVLFGIFICLFVLLLFDDKIIKYTVLGVKEFVINGIPRSLGLGGVSDSWMNDWTSFYWAQWMAWAPVTALFLGRLGRGYTVRTFIKINLIYPSLFGVLWMSLFGGVSIILNESLEGHLHDLLIAGGPQDVIFGIFQEIPFTIGIGILFLVICFLSFVTSADTNTSAMSGLSTHGITPDQPEAPITTKILWGIMLALVSWVMISFADLDGIRILSVLGGFPILFICIVITGKLFLIGFHSFKSTKP